MLNLTSATTLIPYLLVAAYGLMIAKRGETYDVRPGGAATRPDPCGYRGRCTRCS